MVLSNRVFETVERDGSRVMNEQSLELGDGWRLDFEGGISFSQGARLTREVAGGWQLTLHVVQAIASRADGHEREAVGTAVVIKSVTLRPGQTTPSIGLRGVLEVPVQVGGGEL